LYICSIKQSTNMKKLTLVRFGQVPNPQVTAALAPHIIGKAIALPVPGAIVSIFNTESSIETGSDSVKGTGVFFFIMDAAASDSHLPEEIQAAIDKVFGGSAHTTSPVTREYTIDELLDLINQNGIEALTPDQRSQLDSRF